MQKLITLLLLFVVFFSSCSVEVDPSVTTTSTVTLAVIFEFIVTIACLFAGCYCIYQGVNLILLGVGEASSFSLNLLGMSLKINKACPGLILVLLGFVIIIKRGKLKIKIGKSNETKK